jgi:hypothetical protein
MPGTTFSQLIIMKTNSCFLRIGKSCDVTAMSHVTALSHAMAMAMTRDVQPRSGPDRDRPIWDRVEPNRDYRSGPAHLYQDRSVQSISIVWTDRSGPSQVESVQTDRSDRFWTDKHVIHIKMGCIMTYRVRSLFCSNFHATLSVRRSNSAHVWSVYMTPDCLWRF